MGRRVAIITDSTAYLPDSLAERFGVTVVPLHVLVGGVSGAEGVDVRPAEVAKALAERRVRVTTSRPTHAEFARIYQEVLDAGAQEVLSIHLSSELSGTFSAASQAAEEVAGPIRVLDSRLTVMGLGFAVLSAAEAADTGADLDRAAEAALSTARRTTILFYVDSLEHLRRGGRIGAAAALLGTALAVKPILHVPDGSVVLKERVRTASRALARVEELAIDAAGTGACDIAVHHLGAAGPATDLRNRLMERLPRVHRVVMSEIGAVVGTHTGPGTVGAVVVRRS